MFLTGGVSQYTVQTRQHLRKGQLEEYACPRPDTPIRSKSIREDESNQYLGPHRLEGSLLTPRLFKALSSNCEFLFPILGNYMISPKYIFSSVTLVVPD